MVRKYIRKTDRSSISEEVVNNAIEMVRLGSSVSHAAKVSGLNRSTLRHRLKKFPFVQVRKAKKASIENSVTHKDVPLKDNQIMSHHNFRQSTRASRQRNATPVKMVEEDDVIFDSEHINPQVKPPSSSRYNQRQIFSSEEEEQLVEYLQRCCAMNNGLTNSRVRTLAVEFAQRIQCKKIPLSWLKRGSAGEDWFYYFRSRHKDLKLKWPQVLQRK